ncbi:MAG: hypothetical protein WCI97_00255 [Bacteroidota bacterium]
MKKLITLSFSLFAFHFVNAQSFSGSINASIDGAIDFLIHTQQQETIGTSKYKGEWPAYVTNLETSLYLGSRGDSAWDSQCFSNSMIHNVLAEIVLSHPQYSRLIPSLQLSLENIHAFERQKGFAFWHVLPPAPWWKKKKHFKNPELFYQTRPNNYHYKGNFLNKYANISNDADDTGLGYLAYLNSKKLSQLFSFSDTVTLPLFLDSLYSTWRDTRKVRHSFSTYNLTYGYFHRRGAFLTWLSKESFYYPFRLFFPFKHKQNLPMGNNDMDCVVNCNVVRALNAYGLQNTKGFTEAIAFITDALDSKKHCFTCGIYYPSEFTLHYFASEAYREGVTVLKDAVVKTIPFILSSQNADGSWSSALPQNNFHITALCLNALMNSGVKSDSLLHSIEKGISFLLANQKTNDNGTYWTGGIFFTSGYTIRHTHVWRSDAVTTSLVIEALVHYKEAKLK